MPANGHPCAAPSALPWVQIQERVQRGEPPTRPLILTSKGRIGGPARRHAWGLAACVPVEPASVRPAACICGRGVAAQQCSTPTIDEAAVTERPRQPAPPRPAQHPQHPVGLAGSMSCCACAQPPRRPAAVADRAAPHRHGAACVWHHRRRRLGARHRVRARHFLKTLELAPPDFSLRVQDCSVLPAHIPRPVPMFWAGTTELS